MQILEDFIIQLLKKNLIKNYTGLKTEINEFYDKEFRSKAKRPFDTFFRDLWKYWYVNDFTKKYVYFDQRWIIYLSQIDADTRSRGFHCKILSRDNVNKLYMVPQTYVRNALKEKKLEEKNFVNKESCKLCLVKFSDESQFKIHCGATRHKVRVQYLTKKTSFEQSEDIQLVILEVNNVTITDGSLSMKFEQRTNINATLHLINNLKTDVGVLEIIQMNLLITDLTMTTTYEKGSRTNLKPGEHILIVLNGYFENSASFVFPIVFVVQNADNVDAKYFLKEIKVEVTSEFSDLKTNIPYVPVKKSIISQPDFDLVIPGKRPKPYDSFYKEKFPLRPYEIPPAFDVKLKELIMEYPSFVERNPFNFVNKVFHRKFANILGINPVLSEVNYCDLLLALVNIEENQMKVDIRDFDTESKLTFRGGNRYELEVPGLAEARPSLMVNDSVYVKENKDDPRKYQGIVHEVLETAVILGFNKRFPNIFIANKKFHIEFGFNRRSVKVEKQAIWLANEHNIVSYFYPNQELRTNNKRNSKVLRFDNPILNDEQKRAVVNILEGNSAPYLIFGPPGTGKTVTIVEAIMQIWRNQPSAKVLVCAPSNSATNEIALRLVDKIPSTDLFRLLGNMYGKDAKLIKLENIINIKRDGSFYMPSMEDILKFKVVLTTLVTAARIVNGGVPDGHYSHVFIDESGYATESQSLIPMAGILSSSRNRGKVAGQIVLAGDPRQLGPVVHSKFAEDCGYGTSMLERLINTCQIYSRNENNPIPYNERHVTKLVRNYRSHKAILKTPNELFYHNELIPAGNELSDVFTDWEYLKAPGFPVIFHHVVGEDRREQNSPSFFNIQEIEEVVGYISKLEGNRTQGLLINQDHIGVISPYRKQCAMLRRACKKKHWDGIQVGSVEQFQGKEKLIIIVSTVRSKNTNKFEEIDKKCQLGFVRHPKRFNVAITRAKALLIVVGNALVLKDDKNWLNFIQYCVDNKSVAGRAFNLSDNEYLNEEIPSGTSGGAVENVG